MWFIHKSATVIYAVTGDRLYATIAPTTGLLRLFITNRYNPGITEVMGTGITAKTLFGCISAAQPLTSAPPRAIANASNLLAASRIWGAVSSQSLVVAFTTIPDSLYFRQAKQPD